MVVGVSHVGIWCNAFEKISFVKDCSSYNMVQEKYEILLQYEFIKVIALVWINNNTANMSESDNNNNRGRNDVTIESVG